MSFLDDRVVAITGAGRGLGRAYAHFLARRGAKIVVNDNGCAVDGEGEDPSVARTIVAEIVAEGGQAIAHTESIAKPPGAASLVASTIAAFGRLDVLINNAGILRDGGFLDLEDDSWHAVIDTHLHGTFYCARAAARRMVEQDAGGAIINTTSFASIRGNMGQANYAAAKGGILGLTKALAFELAGVGIRVNAVAPIARTRMTEHSEVVFGAMTPERAAALVAFLASPLAGGLTGRVFGNHGSRVFEYTTHQSGGLDGLVEPEEIAAALPAICDGSAALPASVVGHAAGDLGARAKQLVQHLPGVLKARRARRFVGVLDLQLSRAERFRIEVDHGTCRVRPVLSGAEPDTTDGMESSLLQRVLLEADAATWLALSRGALTLPQAFVHARLDTNNFAESMRFLRLFELGKLEALSLGQIPREERV